MRAVWKKALADVRRRRLQAAVVAIVALLSSAVAALATAVLVGTSSPYDTAFERQHGAHLVAWFDARFATESQVRATGATPGVTDFNGPWPSESLPFQAGGTKLTMDLLARESPGGVEGLDITAGRWLTGTGQIVLTRSLADALGVRVGDQVSYLAQAGSVQLRVVALVIDPDIGQYPNFGQQSAWVTPAQYEALAVPVGRGYKMAYRLQHAATAADISHVAAALRDQLPVSAMVFSISYLQVRQIVNLNGSLILTFLVGFGVVALAAAAVIVANVVAGAVLASYRDIGITRALGYSPAQAVAGLLLTILIPALAGVVIGTPLGLLMSAPLLAQSTHALGLAAPPVPPLAVVAAPVVLLAIVAGALLPATRAGRLSPVRAIAAGSAPPPGRRSRLARLLRAARLPRWLTLGAGDAYARPVRGGLTTVAVLVGVATVTFALGLEVGVQRFANDQGLIGGRGDVDVSRLGDYPDASVMRTLNAQPETQQVVALSYGAVTVRGVGDPESVLAWRGPSDSLGFHVINGRWFHAPGEVVAGPAFLTATHLRVGDSFDASLAGRQARFRIVGSWFTTNGLGNVIGMDFADLTALDPTVQPAVYQVILRPGSDLRAYMRRVAATSPDQLEVVDQRQLVGQQLGSSLNSLTTVMAILVALLTLIALAGVFNTILLNTREHMRDTAVLRTVGLSPGGTILMVTTSAVVLGVIGGVMGVPVGIAAYRGATSLVGSTLGSPLGGSELDVYNLSALPLLVAAGVVVAALAALLPARWTAASPVAEVLRSE